MDKVEYLTMRVVLSKVGVPARAATGAFVLSSAAGA